MPNDQAPIPSQAQREALKQSEERAAQSHPENFKDEENESKQVEIPPIEPGGSNIQGLDPEEDRTSER